MSKTSEGKMRVDYFVATSLPKKPEKPKAPKAAATPPAAPAAAASTAMPAAELEALQAKISAQGAKVAELKKGGASKEAVTSEVAVLLALKAKLPAELQQDGKKKKKSKKKKGGDGGGGGGGGGGNKSKKKMKEKPKWNAPGSGKAKKNAKKPKAPKAPVEVFVNKTPVGEKKDMSAEMAQGYMPPAVEASWDAWWEAQGYFSADVARAAECDPKTEKFVMVIPPPNVTGTLHIGHALTVAVEDTIARWHRMCGRPVMWLPGTDHAGIATQAVVERLLWRDEKKTRHDLGREAFLEKVWAWKDAKGATILNQIRRLGASVDHSRTAFTMDDKLTVAVKEAFVRMYEKKLIYRDTRLVNWSHALNTAISDIEVEHVDLEGRTLRSVPRHDPEKKYEFGVIVEFAYKVVGSDEEIVVATTRLETMLGDTAVAVHPEDPRYAHLHGGAVQHPFCDRTIPIVLDPVLVDMAFGTGAVKITPAHDPNDFQCGRRHKLPEISIFNDDGSVNENGGKFAGMMRFDARVAVEEELKAIGQYRGKRDNPMQLPLCSRSGDVIEPRVKPQWWVDCNDMAARAAKCVRDKELTLVPSFQEAEWYRWLDNPRDWCISRQLWWGHRIPAYRVTRKGVALAEEKADELWVVGRSREEAAAEAAAKLGTSVEEVELHQPVQAHALYVLVRWPASQRD